MQQFVGLSASPGCWRRRR